MGIYTNPQGAHRYFPAHLGIHYLLKPRSRQAPPEGNAGLGAPAAARGRGVNFPQKLQAEINLQDFMQVQHLKE